MKELEQVRRDIRDNGFLSALQIVLRVAHRNPGISREELDGIMHSILCKDIHRIEYTNSYVSAYKLKDLYYYNPSPRKRKKRGKKAQIL